jgi:hypothetical protein
MQTHEEHCTMNPQRKCRMCDNSYPNIPNLLAAIASDQKEYGGSKIPKTIDAADGCPACILSAIRQYNKGKKYKDHFCCYEDAVAEMRRDRDGDDRE